MSPKRLHRFYPDTWSNEAACRYSLAAIGRWTTRGTCFVHRCIERVTRASRGLAIKRRASKERSNKYSEWMERRMGDAVKERNSRDGPRTREVHGNDIIPRKSS